LPQASGLAAEIKEQFGVDAQLSRESKGIFDVLIDGHLLFSKYRVDRFPREGEVIKLMKASGSVPVSSGAKPESK
jgi:hypothetical protein